VNEFKGEEGREGSKNKKVVDYERKRVAESTQPLAVPFYTPEIHLIHFDMSNPPEKGEDSIFVYVFV
jgi:hypothetical protein